MRRQAFSLVELLVAITIILVLMALMGAAVSATRGSQKKQATQALIAKLDAVLQRQWESYSSRHISTESMQETQGFQSIPDKAAARAWYVRRNIITADMPDRWTDVALLANPAEFPPSNLSSAQRAYLAIYRARSPTNEYAGAECLFMIIMQGGIAGCLECAELGNSAIGDKDGDRAPEFLDAWGNPIGYILWPAAVELPAGSGTRFFSDSRQLCPPFPASDDPSVTLSPTLGMRPLIYSAGRDGEYGFDRCFEASNLGAGSNGKDCGNWEVDPWSKSGAPVPGSGIEFVRDNLTNLDDEAKR